MTGFVVQGHICMKSELRIICYNTVDQHFSDRNCVVIHRTTDSSQTNMQYLKNIGEGVAAMLSPLGKFPSWVYFTDTFGLSQTYLLLTHHPNRSLFGMLSNPSK